MTSRSRFVALASPLVAGLLAACAEGVIVSEATSGVGGAVGAGSVSGAGGAANGIDCGKELRLCGSLCVDVESDSEHCGDCGESCDGGQVCLAGKCESGCGATLANCGGKCADTENDPSHCGECSKSCPTPPNSEPVCVKGACAWFCNGDKLDCNQVANDGCELDVSQSVAHCGACGKACPAIANGQPLCQSGECKPACNVGYDDCDKILANGCEANLKSDAKHCGACGKTCNSAAQELCIDGTCKVQPFSWNVLAQKDIVYAGHAFLLLKLAYNSATSVSANWCQEYTNLCTSFGYKPTGCGVQFTSMNNGYGVCATQYLSSLPDNSLGCNPSSSIAAAAKQNGFGDANYFNSFGFHYCDSSSCTKTMCSGQNCSSALSYFDYSQPYGYTLCKK